MLEKIANKVIHNDDTSYRSWYDLSKEESNQLEREFKGKDNGKIANDAMVACIVIGVGLAIVCTLMLEIFMFCGLVNPYSFTIMILLILLGLIIVLFSTIEYHIKFNSWLKVKHKIIKK